MLVPVVTVSRYFVKPIGDSIELGGARTRNAVLRTHKLLIVRYGRNAKRVLKRNRLDRSGYSLKPKHRTRQSISRPALGIYEVCAPHSQHWEKREQRNRH
jgi:hypothetical protein